MTRHDGDEHRRDDDEADRGEQRSREDLAGLARLLGEVRDRLESGVGEHRERKREEQVVPALADGEVEPVREHVGREEDGETEHDHEHLHRDVEHASTSAAVWIRLWRTSAGDRRSPRSRDRDDHVPRALAQRRRRRARPRGSAGGTASRARSRSGSRGTAPSPSVKPDEIVEGAARERRGTAGLRASPRSPRRTRARRAGTAHPTRRGRPASGRAPAPRRSRARSRSTSRSRRTRPRRAPARPSTRSKPRTLRATLALQLDPADSERDEQRPEQEPDERRRRSTAVTTSSARPIRTKQPEKTKIERRYQITPAPPHATAVDHHATRGVAGARGRRLRPKTARCDAGERLARRADAR